MVTEKTGLSLHQQWHYQQQVTRKEKIATQITFPTDTLLSTYSRFSFHLLRRVIKAGLLIVREELLWLARER